MPRHISSVPLPSGDGSPVTTLRMSATRSGSGRSRPQLTPAVWNLGLLLPANEIAHGGDGAVCDDTRLAAVDADRSEEAGRAIEEVAYFVFAGKTEIGQAGSLLALTSFKL